MTERAPISVVIPVHNLEGYIRATLQSVLDQTVQPAEVIVVDDGSTDRSVAVVQELAAASGGLIKLQSQRKSGPGAARNSGVKAAQHDWVAFLDGDDLWLSEKIAEVWAAIQAHPEIGIVTHNEYEVGLSGEERLVEFHTYYDETRPLLPQIYRRCFFSTSCMTVRRAALLAAGGFDSNLPSAQDYDLWIRLSKENAVRFVRKPLGKYLLRDGSISMNVSRRYECLLRIGRRYGKLAGRKEFFINAVMTHVSVMRMYRAQGRELAALGTILRLPFELLRRTLPS